MNNLVHVYVVNFLNLKRCKLGISFFYHLFHQNNGKMHILVFNKGKHVFIIVYKVIALNVQGKCTNRKKSVQAYTSYST